MSSHEVEHTFPAIGRKVMLLNARKVHREGNGTQSLLLAIDDVTRGGLSPRARKLPCYSAAVLDRHPVRSWEQPTCPLMI